MIPYEDRVVPYAAAYQERGHNDKRLGETFEPSVDATAMSGMGSEAAFAPDSDLISHTKKSLPQPHTLLYYHHLDKFE